MIKQFGIKQLGKFALAVALGAGTIASTAIPANAVTMIGSPYSDSAAASNVVNVDYKPGYGMQGNRRWSRSQYGQRCQAAYGKCRHFYRGYYYETPWWTLPLIVGGAIASQNHGQSHVQWCLSRYRSYDPRTNTYLGNDGLRHICR
jgi:hypothetical protein